MQRKKYSHKTPKAQAFGVFVLVFWWCSALFAACPAERIDETVRIAHVVDGDTLRAEDGRRIRVLGINAPELGRKGQASEAYGRQALEAVKAFLPKDQRVHLVYDRQRTDRYDRLLAHVYNPKRESLAAMLLEQGLAFQVVVPPNISEVTCLASQESRARQQGVGIWRERQWQVKSAADLSLDAHGFMRVSGVITKVTVARDIWLELDGPVVIKVAVHDQHYFDRQQWNRWKGKTVQVRGWVVDRSSEAERKRGFKPLQLQLRHPVMLEAEPK